ncbi:hypothetical protein OIU78_026532 [Salix suchowensis]|nr:hypothetical protein OIU78_026532 [Salix suchowensis]
MVEEADFKVFAKKGDEKSLDRFIPKSESDFLEYAELISHKLRSFEESYHYIGLLKAIMRLSVTAMKAADAKEVSASVTAIANEKIKLRKKPTLAKRSKVHDSAYFSYQASVRFSDILKLYVSFESWILKS